MTTLEVTEDVDPYYQFELTGDDGDVLAVCDVHRDLAPSLGRWVAEQMLEREGINRDGVVLEVPG